MELNIETTVVFTAFWVQAYYPKKMENGMEVRFVYRCVWEEGAVS